MDLIDRDKVLKLIPSEDMVARIAVANATVVDAVPTQWLYDLADKKEEEKDIKLSAMIKGVVALWHMEQEKQDV